MRSTSIQFANRVRILVRVLVAEVVRDQPSRRTWFGCVLLATPACPRPSPARGLAERQCLGLREDVRHQHIVMPAERIQRPAERDEIARDQPRALVNQLIERVLAVRPRLAPVDRAGLCRPSSPSSVTCLPLLSIVNCCR